MADTGKDVDALTQLRASDVLRDTDRDSVGVTRILSKAAGTPGEEREYEVGDEALVESGQAEWVVAPVHLPSAGRRLDGDAEREATPLDGAEVYPPAEPTTFARRSDARAKGWVEAHSDEGVGEKIAKARLESARKLDKVDDSDVKLQAELGGRAARSGPVTAHSDLAADDVVEAAPADDSQPVGAAKEKSAPVNKSGSAAGK